MLTDLWQSIKPAKVRTPVCQQVACNCILPHDARHSLMGGMSMTAMAPDVSELQPVPHMAQLPSSELS